MSEIEVFAKSIVTEAAKKLSPITFLSAQVREMDRADVEHLAVAYLFAQLKNRQRATVAVIERSSAATKPRKGTRAWEEWIESPEGADERALQDQLAREDSDRFSKLWDSMSGMIDNYRQQMRMEWNDELLSSEFGLADGTKVTWGAATKEDHEWRIQMHMKNAAAGVEGAARHQLALETLAHTGCLTLGDAVAVAA